MTPNDILVDLYKKLTSRKFLAFVLATALLLADNFGYIALDSETKRQIITLVLGYLVVEGGVDGVRAIQAAKSGSI